VATQNIMNPVLERHGLQGIMTTVIGKGSVVGEQLINDKRIPLVSFTGSTRMGKRVGEVVGGRLGNTILELGGNNCIIVAPSANLDMAMRSILFGAVGTAGQRCTSTRRVIMHKSVAAELTEKLVSTYPNIRIGNPLDSNTLMGPLVDRTAVDTMMAALAELRENGAEVLCGGKELNDGEYDGGHFVTPSLVKASNDLDVVQRETFAPILYLMEYDEIDEAIAMHNNVPQGLSSSIFSNNILETEAFLSHRGSDCGIANVNIGTSGAEIGLAFGGEKDTGGGRESGSDAWKAYMRRQSNTINWGTELPLAQGVKFDV
jgi:aldehyde dehydrogenase (NAD+)